MSRRAVVAKTYKLYVGGAFVRSESGRTDPVGRAPTSRAPRARTCATRSAARRRAGRLGGAHRLQPRPDPLPRRRGAGVARRRARRRPDRRGRRRARALRGLDRQAARRAGRRQPGRGAVPVASRCPSRPAWSAWSRPTSPPCSAWWARSRPALAAGNTVVAVDLERSAAARAGPRRGRRRLRRARRRDQPAVRPPRRAARGARRAPRPQRDRRRRGRRRARAELDELAAETVKRVSRPAAGRRPARAPRGGDRAQDGLAPDRGLGAASRTRTSCSPRWCSRSR